MSFGAVPQAQQSVSVAYGATQGRDLVVWKDYRQDAGCNVVDQVVGEGWGLHGITIAVTGGTDIQD